MAATSASGGTTPSAPRPDPRTDQRSTGEVLQSVASTSQALVRKEIELAKLEILAIVQARAIAVALLAAAGLLGLYVLGFLGVLGAKLLELVVASWLAWLIITLLYALIAGILVAVAMTKLKKPPSTPERTKQGFEETKQWAQARAEKVLP